MAKRRDIRRFGPGPYLLGFTREKWVAGFPFNVPAMATIERLCLDQPVTLLAGDNGSGKSTVLEAIAAAVGFAEQGGELDRLGELPAVPRKVLDDSLGPVLSNTKPRNGYYLRAESFFNLAAFIDRATGLRRTSLCTAMSRSTGSPTASRFWRSRPTDLGLTASTCSTSRRRRYRSPEPWRFSRS